MPPKKHKKLMPPEEEADKRDLQLTEDEVEKHERQLMDEGTDKYDAPGKDNDREIANSFDNVQNEDLSTEFKKHPAFDDEGFLIEDEIPKDDITGAAESTGDSDHGEDNNNDRDDNNHTSDDEAEEELIISNNHYYSYPERHPMGQYFNAGEISTIKDVKGRHMEQHIVDFLLLNELSRPVIYASHDELDKYYQKWTDGIRKFLSECSMQQDREKKGTHVCTADPLRLDGDEILSSILSSLILTTFPNKKVLLALVTAMKEYATVWFTIHDDEALSGLVSTTLAILAEQGIIKTLLTDMWQKEYHVISEFNFASLMFLPHRRVVCMNPKNNLQGSSPTNYIALSKVIMDVLWRDSSLASESMRALPIYFDSRGYQHVAVLSAHIRTAMKDLPPDLMIKFVVTILAYVEEGYTRSQFRGMIDKAMQSNLVKLLVKYCDLEAGSKTIGTPRSVMLTFREDTIINIMRNIVVPAGDAKVPDASRSVQEKPVEVVDPLRGIYVFKEQPKTNSTAQLDEAEIRRDKRELARNDPTTKTKAGEPDKNKKAQKRPRNSRSKSRSGSRTKLRSSRKDIPDRGQPSDRGRQEYSSTPEPEPRSKHTLDRSRQGYSSSPRRDTVSPYVAPLILPENDNNLPKYKAELVAMRGEVWNKKDMIRNDLSRASLPSSLETIKRYDDYLARLATLILEASVEMTRSEVVIDATKRPDPLLPYLTENSNVFIWAEQVKDKLCQVAQVIGPMEEHFVRIGAPSSPEYRSVVAWMIGHILLRMNDTMKNQCGQRSLLSHTCPIKLLRFIEDKLKTDAMIFQAAQTLMNGAKLQAGELPGNLMHAITRDYRVLAEHCFNDPMKFVTMCTFSRLSAEIKNRIDTDQKTPSDMQELNDLVTKAYQSAVTVNTSNTHMRSASRREQTDRDVRRSRTADNEPRHERSTRYEGKAKPCGFGDGCSKPTCTWTHPDRREERMPRRTTERPFTRDERREDKPPSKEEKKKL